jgi:hypothetical protein
MQNFITMSQLASSEGFGSQMGNFASLYAVTRRSGHRIVFFSHLTGGKGLQVHLPFEQLPLEVLAPGAIPANTQIATFKVDRNVVVDSRVYALDEDTNYEIEGLLGSYRYWYPLREEVYQLFRFKSEIAQAARAQLAAVDARGREIVAVHVRRGDYLTSEDHANLSISYYSEAFAQFRGEGYCFLVFSDDMAWCRQAFGRRANVYYAQDAGHYADMCAMSLCAHNIVANSSFSAWGALLNRNPRRKVVCPAQYLKQDRLIPYLNHAWYPDDWVPLEDWQG